MGKVWNYVFISIGLMMLLQFSGMEVGAASQLFTLAGVSFNDANEINSTTTSSSNFFEVLFNNKSDGSLKGILITIGLSLGAVAVGLFTRAKVENLILLPFLTGTLVLFISALVDIVRISIDLGIPWVAALISIIFVPFTVGFIMSLGEYFRGTD